MTTEGPRTVETMAADNEAMVGRLLEVATEQRDELRTTNHRRTVEIAIVAIALATFVVLLIFVLVVLGKVRATQLEGVRRGKTILTLAQQTKRIAVDTNQVAVQFNCAIALQRDHPEFAPAGTQPGEIDAFDACVASHTAPSSGP